MIDYLKHGKAFQDAGRIKLRALPLLPAIIQGLDEFYPDATLPQKIFKSPRAAEYSDYEPITADFLNRPRSQLTHHLIVTAVLDSALLSDELMMYFLPAILRETLEGNIGHEDILRKRLRDIRTARADALQLLPKIRIGLTEMERIFKLIERDEWEQARRTSPNSR